MRSKRILSFCFATPVAIVSALVLVLVPLQAGAAAPPGPFFQGFEKNSSGWFDSTNGGDGTITRVLSGYVDGGYADGIASAAGKWHARFSGNPPSQCDHLQYGVPCYGPFTRWGGYSATFPAGGYKTQADIYLDVDWAKTHLDYRFDWDSSINDTTGGFLRDFVFNVGTSPTGGSVYFVNASTNAFRSGAFPWNPCPNPASPPNTCRMPASIVTSGWYTFRHTFRNDGGFLAVDFDIFQLATGAHIASWTIHPGDAMTGVGGNRYGWFAMEEIPQLPIDNTLRTGLCHSHEGDGEMDGKDSGKAKFHSQAQGCEGQNDQQGNVQESDPGSGTNFQSTSVNSATFTSDEDSQTVTMVGTGVDNGLPVAFTMIAVDNGALGPGLFSLVLSDGYAITGTLTSGTIAIQ
jgi:hypothetical protein